ncbi:MAG: hypothetical protein U0667_01650 [Chloroflexota bacterium]
MSEAGPPASRRPSAAPFVVVAGFLVVAVVLVLIGAERSAAPAPSIAIARPGTSAQPRDVVVIMRDYLFEPTPLVLVPGETIRLTVFDAGLQPHELVLGDARFQESWAAAHAAATPPAPFATPPPASVPPDAGVGVRVWAGSGNQATVAWTVPSSSQLLLMCHLPGHVAKGMIGQVELRAEPPTASPIPSGPS